MEFDPLICPTERFASRTIATMLRVRGRVSEIKTVALSSSCSEFEKQCAIESADKFELLSYQIILNLSANNDVTIAENQSFTKQGYEKLRGSVSEVVANYDMASITLQQIQDSIDNPCSDAESATKILKLLGQMEQALYAYVRKVRKLRCKRKEKKKFLLLIGLLRNFVAEGKFGFYLYHEDLIPDEFWRSVVSDYRTKAGRHLGKIAK